MIYLASPYSDPSADVMEQRYREACKAAASLMEQGEVVYSPISHSHGIALHGGLPADWRQWECADRQLLAACDCLVVLRLPGWSTSEGITDEMELAEELGIRIEFIEPHGLTQKETGQ